MTKLHAALQAHARTIVITDTTRWLTVWARLGLFVLAFVMASAVVIAPLATFLIEGGLIVTLTTAGLAMVLLLIRVRQDVPEREGDVDSP